MVSKCKSYLSIVDGNLFDVVKELSPVESRYYNIGLGLRLKMEYLDDIRRKYNQNACEALRKVIDAWLKQRYDVSKFGPPTWQMLVRVIDDHAGGNDHQLAEKIALDHPAGECTIKASFISRCMLFSILWKKVMAHTNSTLQTDRVTVISSNSLPFKCLP